MLKEFSIVSMWVLLEALKAGMSAGPREVDPKQDREWKAGLSAANRIKAQARAERKAVARKRRMSPEK